MRKIIFYLLLIFVLFLVGCASGSRIGPIGSTHRHADIKVYVLGNPIDFGVQKFQVVVPHTHFENRDGDIVHTHAIGVTLGHLFDSLGMSIDDECLTLDTGNKYCSQGNAQLKVFIQKHGTSWRQIFDADKYAIQEFDKILVSFGTEDEEGIIELQESVTDKAPVT